ncbi:drug resistance efflux protein [Secundilactobacillus odoratitofui DSM 19909 = JCM 15043]|uniref:Drug resistance efflux protein n=1 Tax=Secundilactobacillus odoratitofui DSM 19909 = JCM 15043 TaxID=1423776 RepID=A0A0R1LSG4_9LACO|nr:MFS transporter [Secundilactobacillus odoratitofui]KRK98591.1 drug resistance efflux protein [Secundilactobacillus odoratitofui DSM 19909 = JCM 15043]
MEDQPVSWQTKLSISAAALLSFMGILVETSLNVTFPRLTQTFSVSLGTMQWVTSGYLLMVTIIMSTTGFLNQRFDARTLFRTAILFNLIGTLLCASASSFSILLLGRMFQAVSTGIATPLMFHMVLSLIPQSKRGVYMGTAAMIISFAPALGPTYGGTLAAFWSWRGIFIIAIPILLVVAMIGERTIRLKAEGTHDKFDWVGVVLLALTFGSLSTAFANAGNHGFLSADFGELLLVFVIATGLLTIHLHRSTRRILNFRLLLHPLIGLRWLNFFILQFINIGISFVIPIFAEDVLHVSAFVAGLILLPGALFGAALSPAAGRLFDTHGAFMPLLISSSAMLVGTLLFFLTSSATSAIVMTLIYVFLRGGFNMGFSNSMSDASMQINLEQNADLNSLFNTFQQYAGSFGTSVLSAVIAAHQNAKGSLAQLTIAGSRMDYGILVILALISLTTVLVARRYSKQRQVEQR